MDLGDLKNNAVAEPFMLESDAPPPATPPSRLVATGLQKSYGSRKVVRDVSLSVESGEVVGLLGPNGAGKTTSFYMIVGLVRADAGEITIDSNSVEHMPIHRRARLGLSYLPQEASIFRKLNVEENVRAVLELQLDEAGKPLDKAAIAERLDALLKDLRVDHLRDSPSLSLSGGERRRVEIARALATQPRLLLLDEPLASLDLARRREILPWLERLRDELHIPMLYVTHSADEVARLADALVVLDRGRVAASGPVASVMAGLAAPLLLGDDAGALLEGTVGERDARWQLARVDFDGGSLWLRDSGAGIGRRVRLRVLARDVSIATDEPRNTSIQNLLPAVVRAIAADAHPSQALVQLACGDSILLSRITARAVDALGLQPGTPVWAQVKSVALVE